MYQDVSYHPTILVVDDVEAILAVLCETLEAAGYQAISARSAKEALAISDSFVGIIDLLLTDITMSGMGGLELAELLLKQRPRIRVLFMSASGLDFASESFHHSSGEIFLQKPFALTELKSRVAKALA